MGRGVSRREFVKAGAAASVVAAAPKAGAVEGPTVLVRRATPPVVIASANGHQSRNGGPRTCVEEAFSRITAGEDVLDALIAGVNIVELDPEESGVGYGGLPNAEGVVQLDSCCMHGPKKRAGGVAALEGVRTPSLVAKAVMEQTDHHLLVGGGAREFARQMGFPIEDDLNTDLSRERWLEWRRRIDPGHWLDPQKRSQAGEAASRAMVAEGLLDPESRLGTINCDGVGPGGDVCGVTTTSGLAFKIPGRVGDSPILGAGLWLDGDVGVAGSTGRGEANLFGLCSHLIVEEMRRGSGPRDAAMEALRRVKANTVEKRLLGPNGEPAFGLSFYVISRTGEFAGVTMWGKEDGRTKQFAVCTENGPELLPCDSLLGDPPTA
jgi:N4-(beta-N-acetylglucosaminyl)-L-asparaginase